MVEELGLLFCVAGEGEIATVLGEIAEAFFDHRALEGSVRLQAEAGGAADGVELGGEDGEADDLAIGAFHEDAVATLEIVFKLAEGGLLPGGIEDEVATARLGRDDAAEFG